MKRKLLFFINPISGVRSKRELELKIAIRCDREGASYEIMNTNKEGDYSFLPEKINAESISDIVICGGDGSISPIVSCVLGLNVQVGIVPLGSGNGLARTAGIPHNTDKAIDILFSGAAQPVDAFRVNGRLGCQIIGLGYDAFVAAEFAKERKRGLSTYTKLAVKHFFKAKPYQFTLEYDGEKINRDAFILCVANANQFGNNLKIAPLAKLNDQQLDVVVLKKTDKLRILQSFVSHLLFPKKQHPRKSGKEPKIIYVNAQHILIHNKSLAPVHIDGDPVETHESFEIQVVPKAYRLIHPA